MARKSKKNEGTILYYYRKKVEGVYQIISIETKEILCTFSENNFEQGLTDFIRDMRSKGFRPINNLDYIEE